MARISILMPVYNSEKYLNETLKSIKKQSFKDFEVLIIDDGSTDNSGKICDYYVEEDNRFYVRHQKNQGSGMARNAAIEWAIETESEYIVWIDADDIIHEMYLEILYNTIVKYPECDIVQCGYSSSESILNKTNNYFSECEKILNNEELLINMASQKSGIDFTILWNKIYKKDLYNKARVVISDRFSGRMQDDINILSQIYTQSQGCGVIKDKLYFYRIVKNSIQHKKISNVNLEYLYFYTELYLRCKGTALDAFAKELSESIFFDIALQLRWKKSKYIDYKNYYSNLRGLYKETCSEVEFTFKRLDLIILKKMVNINFYFFRIYGRLYQFRERIKYCYNKV